MTKLGSAMVYKLIIANASEDYAAAQASSCYLSQGGQPPEPPVKNLWVFLCGFATGGSWARSVLCSVRAWGQGNEPFFGFFDRKYDVFRPFLTKNQQMSRNCRKLFRPHGKVT